MTEQQIPTSVVLDRAADLIEERGWTTGEGWPNFDGDAAPLCLEGGIMAAAGHASIFGMHRACPAYRAVSDYLGRDYEEDQRFMSRGVWNWNDAAGRTQEQVVATLRACAVIEAAKEDEAANQSPAATPNVEPAL